MMSFDGLVFEESAAFESPRLGELISAFNRYKVGRGVIAHDMTWTAYRIFVRQGEEVVAGLVGVSEFGWMIIDLVHVHSAFQNKGIGAHLLAMVEAEAKRRNCIGMRGEVYSREIPAFYRSRGFVVQSIIDAGIPGRSIVSLQKRFNK